MTRTKQASEAQEPDVTPEMLEAGEYWLGLYDSKLIGEEEALRNIFVAMLAAKCQ